MLYSGLELEDGFYPLGRNPSGLDPTTYQVRNSIELDF